MRQVGTAVMMAAALLAVGCGREEAKKERALDARARRIGYQPPATMTRAEFGGVVERRFHGMDTDGDGYIARAEWTRSPDRFAREDGDGDGRLSADEFGRAALARFDARDSNGDGTVTQPEWQAAHARREARTAAR